MSDVLKMTRYFLMAILAISLAGSFSAAAYGQKKPKIIKEKKTTAAQKKKDTESSAEPDKVLYESAMKDIKHSKYTDARLALQTLVNTYPDSEYLAKAKLAVADSFYKEAGTSSLTQAVEEYKNFIVFFPFLDEAAYAQMQVGMAHYRMMEKSDRDSSQAQAAEDEFQAFLLKYPQNPLIPKAEQDLRDVQEVIADGQFRIASFYYVKQDYRASAARLVEVSSRYPLYSQSDLALSMLGDVYMRAKQVSPNEDEKNHWADNAAQCYDRILMDYPLSKLAPDAKAHLTAMGMPIPAASPGALARMQQQQLYAKHHHPNPMIHFPVGMFRSSPDVYASAHTGPPNLNPPDDSFSATEVLKQGAAGPTFTLKASTPTGGGGGDSGSVDTESTDSSSDSSSTPTATTGVQILNAPGAGDANGAAPAPAVPAGNPPVENSGAANASPDPAPASPATQPAAGGGSQAGSQQTPAKADSKNESTSKKKKGLRKVVPW